MFRNLFTGIPDRLAAEQIDVLVESPRLRLQRIVSTGQATPPGEWYDQETDEWVIVLRGSAGLRFEGETEPVTLRPGDHVLVPAHRRHRVEWTDAREPTVWLALHYWAGGESRSATGKGGPSGPPFKTDVTA